MNPEYISPARNPRARLSGRARDSGTATRDDYSSAVHYAICYPELVGQEEATRVFAFWRGGHYRAMNAAAVDGGEAIGAIVMRESGAP